MSRAIPRLVLALALPALMVGCAPSFGAGGFGPGLQIGLNLGSAPSLAIAPATCLLQRISAPTASSSAAATAGAMRQQAAQIQARHSLGSGAPGTRAQSWKRLASGGC